MCGLEKGFFPHLYVYFVESFLSIKSGLVTHWKNDLLKRKDYIK